MSAKRFLLGVACAAILARVESSSTLVNRTATMVTEYPDELLSSDADTDSSLVTQMNPEGINVTREEARSFLMPSSFEATVHGWHSKAMDLNGRYKNTIDSFLSKLHLRLLSWTNHTPLEVATYLKLPKDGTLFDSWQLKLLERFIKFLPSWRKTDATLLDTVIKHFGGEDKFAPFLFKFTERNAGGRSFLTMLFTKRRSAWKASLQLPGDETLATSRKLELVKDFIDFRPYASMSKVRVVDTTAKDLSVKVRHETFMELVVEDFGGKTELARVLFKFAANNRGDKRVESFWLPAILDSLKEDNKPFEEVFAELHVKEAGGMALSDDLMDILKTIVPEQALHRLLIKEFGSEGRLALALIATKEAQADTSGQLFDIFMHWRDLGYLTKDLRERVFSEWDDVAEDLVKKLETEFHPYVKYNQSPK